MCVHPYVRQHIFHNSNQRYTSITRGSLFHSCSCTVAHASTCTYERKHELTHATLPLLLSSSTWDIESLKKAFTVKSFHGIRSFTSLFMLHLRFFFVHDQWSWKSANESLMDRMEQSKRGAWPRCPSLLPLPRLFEQSVSDQDQLSGPNGGNSVRRGLVSLMPSPLTTRPFCDWVRIGQQGSCERGKCKRGISRTNGPNLSLMLISVN